MNSDEHYGQQIRTSRKLIKEAQEYDFLSDVKLVSSVNLSWAHAQKWHVINSVFSWLLREQLYMINNYKYY